MRFDHLRVSLCRAALVAPLLLAACAPGGAGRPSEARQAESVEAAKATVAPKPAQPTPTPGAAAGNAGTAGGPAAAPPSPAGAVPVTGSPGAVASSPAPVAKSAAGGQFASVAPAAPQPRQGGDPNSLRVVLEPLPVRLERPLLVTHAGDGSGRLFVVEKAGRIVILRDGQPLAAPFLDISGLVGSSGSEQGLLGLAFHPRYSENGRFFVNYTDRRGDTVVAEYRVSGDPNIADPATARQLLWLDQPAQNHNGGHLAFGPDGYLWIGTGDGGGSGDRFGNGQNPRSLLGKMLRIDVDNGDPYGIPADNPFADAGRNTHPEIWAIGLRNPWRYTFDRATNDLWIADVGQNAYEEVNVQRAGSQGGENYGWPSMEGMHCFPAGRACDEAPYELPVAEYGRDGGCSITGGYVYRGSQYPELAGLYLFGDFCSGKLWSLDEPTPGTWRMVELLDTPLQISSFGEDESGELYVTSFHDNRIHRVTVGS